MLKVSFNEPLRPQKSFTRMEKGIIEVKLKVDEKLWQVFKEAVKQRTGSSKALSGTVTKLIQGYVANPQDHAHTHMLPTKSVTQRKTEKITERILYDPMYATGSTNKQVIQKLISETIGGDRRTLDRYTPLVVEQLKENGFEQHPRNKDILIQEGTEAYDYLIGSHMQEQISNKQEYEHLHARMQFAPPRENPR